MFKKTEIQEKALKLLGGEAKHILLFGGSRSGKTFILVYAILVRAIREAGSRHIILRYRANSVRQSVRLDTFSKVVKLAFPKLKFFENSADGYITLANKSEIWFGGLDNEERADRILGKEFATIYFNECSEINFESVNTALTRLAQKTKLVNKVYYDCNPAGKSHWSYKLFIDKLDPITNIKVNNPASYVNMLMNPIENKSNLPENYIEDTLETLSEKQRKRFLSGEWFDDNELGIWNYELLNELRVPQLPVPLKKIVISVDPAVTFSNKSDLTGIVVLGVGENDHFYILEDASIQATPNAWAMRVIQKYHEYNALKIIGEINNGGDLIESLLKSIDSSINFQKVRASQSKSARAEIAFSLYEQKRVHHVGILRELEQEMCSYNEKISNYSPDRMDALVWGLIQLNSRKNRVILA